MLVEVNNQTATGAAYIATHWNWLQMYLNDGHVDMGSNPIENWIRPLALGRSTICSKVMIKTLQVTPNERSGSGGRGAQ